MTPLVAQTRAPQSWWRHSCDIEDKPAVTTATTHSTIDETLSPSMLHLQCLRSRHMRKDCVRSQFGLSSSQSCAASGGKPHSKCEVFCLCSRVHLLVWFSHHCGHVQDAEAEVHFHDGAIIVGCKCTIFPCHFLPEGISVLESSFSVSEFSSKAASQSVCACSVLSRHVCFIVEATNHLQTGFSYVCACRCPSRCSARHVNPTFVS